ACRRRRSSRPASARPRPAPCSFRDAFPAGARRSGTSAAARASCSRSRRATRRSRSSSRPIANACRTSSTCRRSSRSCARSAAAAHALLIRLGDLTRDELKARSEPGAPVDEWLFELQRDRRAIAVPLARETRWIAAEDAGRYRDALGVVVPPGLPDAFLASDL